MDSAIIALHFKLWAGTGSEKWIIPVHPKPIYPSGSTITWWLCSFKKGNSDVLFLYICDEKKLSMLQTKCLLDGWKAPHPPTLQRQNWGENCVWQFLKLFKANYLTRKSTLIDQVRWGEKISFLSWVWTLLKVRILRCSYNYFHYILCAQRKHH